MSELPPDIAQPVSIEQLLLRGDTWLGHSQRFMQRDAVSSGHVELDKSLLNSGWPLKSLVEVCQAGMQGEWQLFTPALLKMSGLIALLNPPADPFCQAFIQAGLDLERLIIVNATEKDQFIACFIELARAGVDAVVGWQPDENMTYTELRKCALAASEGAGLAVIFRPSDAQQQSSPASLRLFVHQIPTGLEITIFKQKGHLQTQQARPVVIGLPEQWQPALPYHELNRNKVPVVKPPSATVTPLRGKP